MDLSTLWTNFLGEIEQKLNSASFYAWFTEDKLISLKDNVITIQVPMEMHKNILISNYYTIIEECFYNLTGENYDIEFVLPGEVNDEQSNVKQEIKKLPIDDLWKTNLISTYTFDNYIVGNSNKLAKMAALAVAEAPGKIHNPLFLYGKSGLGKTHLMHAIGNFIFNTNPQLKVLYVTSDIFMNDYTGIAATNINKVDYSTKFKEKYRNVDVLIIDDIQFLVAAGKSQDEFFNTFNELHQANKQIIISSDRSPNDLKLLEERLRSRFMWGLPVDIYPPDFDLRCRIIENKIKNTNFASLVGREVIEYIANNCQNDVRFIEGTVNRLMAYTAMMVPKKIDLEFANEALKDYVNVNVYANNSIEFIQQVISEHYGFPVDDLKGKKKSAKIAYPRQIAMYLCRTQTEESFARIGMSFGGRDHSTVISAVNKIEKELKTDVTLQNTINDIKNKL